MGIAKLRVFLAAVISGLLLALAFPPFGHTVLLPLALAPWFAALAVEKRKSFGLYSGILFGLVFWCVSVPWVAFVVTHYGGQPGWMGAVCVFLLAAILAQWSAIVGWGAVAAFRPGSFWRLAALPILWMSMEHFRSFIYKGFPWNLTANALFRRPIWLQSAAIWGAYGIAGGIAAISACVAAAVVLPGVVRRLGALILAATILAGAWLYGKGRVGGNSRAPSVRVSAIQPNIAQSERGSAQEDANNYRRVILLAERAARSQPDLLLIPESSFPMSWSRSAILRSDLSRISRECGCAILFNDIDEESDSRYFNAARLLTPAGLVPQTYRKLHLVPFGEYVPLPKLFFFMRSISHAVGSFSAAPAPILLSSKNLRIGPSVCYEMTYPSLVRDEARLGANFFATISNDAWYGRAGAQQQHFAAMVLRAIENGRSFARAAITGVSGAVDSRGRIVAEIAPDFPGIASASLQLFDEKTIWMGDGFRFVTAADVLATLVVCCGLLRWRRKQ